MDVEKRGESRELITRYFMKKKIFGLSVVLVAVDQLIKFFVMNTMYLYQSIKVIPNFLYLTYVENDGCAFSILSGGRWFFIIIGVIALILMFKFIFDDTKISKFDTICYSLITSGIVGNLIDRIFYGKVIDYIDFHLFGYDAPVFNFADMCIVIGAVMVIYILMIKGDSNESVYGRKRIK